MGRVKLGRRVGGHSWHYTPILGGGECIFPPQILNTWGEFDPQDLRPWGGGILGREWLPPPKKFKTCQPNGWGGRKIAPQAKILGVLTPSFGGKADLPPKNG